MAVIDRFAGTIISARDLCDLLARRRVVLFDCSFDLADPAAGRSAFRDGHIEGAQYLHLDDDMSGPSNGVNGRHPLPDPDHLARRLRDGGMNDGDHVVAYDSSGGAFAARLWWLLRWLGHKDIAVLDGGLPAWREAGFAIMGDEPTTVAAGDFTHLNIRDDLVVDAAEVLANIALPRFVLIDARAPGRYRGEPNPLDPVAGHIPGARNRFFQDNLGTDGRFKPISELRAAFDQVMNGKSSGDIVLQCGSGVTACHNALALEIAGYGGARLYPGSWSEWISDPTRPIVPS